MDLDSARVQTAAWIRFMVEVDDENGKAIRVDSFKLPFNSWMTEIFQSSDLKEIVSRMLSYMKEQIENPALANSRFRFNEVIFLDFRKDFFKLMNSSLFGKRWKTD